MSGQLPKVCTVDTGHGLVGLLFSGFSWPVDNSPVVLLGAGCWDSPQHREDHGLPKAGRLILLPLQRWPTVGILETFYA